MLVGEIYKMEPVSKEELENQIREIEKEIWEKEKAVVKLKKELSKTKVQDYTFTSPKGKIKLSELFGDKSDLIIIHNMGKKCPYCTMWADGFNGLIHHITDRTAFAVVSPDNPDVQHEFAKSRNWEFPLVSAESNSFTKDMGYEFDGKKFMPGVSVFYKESTGEIIRTGMDIFGPGDNYNSPWHLFRLLKDGINEWNPKFEY